MEIEFVTYSLHNECDACGCMTKIGYTYSDSYDILLFECHSCAVKHSGKDKIEKAIDVHKNAIFNHVAF